MHMVRLLCVANWEYWWRLHSYSYTTWCYWKVWNDAWPWIRTTCSIQDDDRGNGEDYGLFGGNVLLIRQTSAV